MSLLLPRQQSPSPRPHIYPSQLPSLFPSSLLPSLLPCLLPRPPRGQLGIEKSQSLCLEECFQLILRTSVCAEDHEYPPGGGGEGEEVIFAGVDTAEKVGEMGGGRKGEVADTTTHEWLLGKEPAPERLVYSVVNFDWGGGEEK